MKPLHLLVLLVICLTWGGHMVVIKATVADVPPIFYAASRMLLVALCLSPFLRWHQGQMGRIALAALGFGGINYAFMFAGLKYTTAGIGGILIETYVPIATIFSVLFLGERIGWRRIVGLVFAFSGVVVIVSAEEGSVGATNLPLGAFLLLCAATCEATGAIMIKKIDTRVSPLRLLAWFGVIGGSATALLSLLFESGQAAVFEAPTRTPYLLALCYSVGLASIVGHASYYWLLQRVEVSKVAGAGVLTTLFVVLFGIVFLGEVLTLRFVIGGVVTLIGVTIIVSRQQVPRRQASPAEAVRESP